jgi:ubiquinone/menaquinone biosynthesis C-methylase UbiE
MEEAIKRVQQYWDAYATGLEVQGKPWGSKEFFSEIKSEHDEAYAYANQLLNLANLKGRSLLELGCGIGLDTLEFARHGAEVTAIDLSPMCIALAKRLLAYHTLEATLELGNAEDLSYPPDSFDLVIARGILMYTPDDSRVADEIFRVLKPGGEANILLHNRFSWYAFLAKISGTNLFHEAGDPPVNKLYSVSEARQIFAKFSSCRIFFDRFPETTTKRTGVFAQLYNRAFVPVTQIFPNAMINYMGFYIIIKAFK